MFLFPQNKKYFRGLGGLNAEEILGKERGC